MTDKRTRQRIDHAIYDLAYECEVGSQRNRGNYSSDPGVWTTGPVPAACVSVMPEGTLTVVYLPENPKRHLVYELSRFVVEDAGPRKP